MANCIACRAPLQGSDKSFTSTCTSCVQKRPNRSTNEVFADMTRHIKIDKSKWPTWVTHAAGDE